MLCETTRTEAFTGVNVAGGNCVTRNHGTLERKGERPSLDLTLPISGVSFVKEFTLIATQGEGALSSEPESAP